MKSREGVTALEVVLDLLLVGLLVGLAVTGFNRVRRADKLQAAAESQLIAPNYQQYELYSRKSLPSVQKNLGVEFTWLAKKDSSDAQGTLVTARCFEAIVKPICTT